MWDQQQLTGGSCAGQSWGSGTACTAAHRLLSLSTLIAYLLLVFRA